MSTFTLVDSRREIPIVISHNKQNKLTKIVIRGSHTKIISGFELTDEDLFPIIMKSFIGNYKLQFNLDE